MLEIYDYIIINDKYRDIEPNSVGVIEEVLVNNKYKVFFIGTRKEYILSEDNISFLDLSKTGKPYEYKVCNICHILKKDFIDFEINQTDAKGRKTTRPSCRSCRALIDGKSLLRSERLRMNKEKPKKFFVCPICNKGCIPDVTANLVIDHCHETGFARQWICDSCNTGLGRFKDDVDYLERAIAYLKKYDFKDI